MTTSVSLPYFDILLSQLDSGIPALDLAFGRHVHWGFWEDPRRATGTPEDFAEAAERLSQKVYRAARVREGEKVLDAGCGFGGTLASLNENFSNLDLTGLNIDARQIARAKTKFQARAGNRLQYAEGDACAMPFPDDAFDAVLAVECIFHFPDRRKFFSEARRVLKPGGRLAICDFLPGKLFRRFTASQGMQRSLAPIFGPMKMNYTLSDYRALAEETGFAAEEETDITPGTIPTYPFLRSLQKIIGPAGGSHPWAGYSTEWVGRLGWLKYYVLSWRLKA